MNLNGVSALKRRLIFQALDTWHDCNESGLRFTLMMEKDFGWSSSLLHSSPGSFKNCLWKKSIVVKFGKNGNNCDELTREYEQYLILPQKCRKHLPRSYILENGLLIQDRVLVKCKEEYGVCVTYDIRKQFENRLQDYHHNHGHSKKGTVKFFDWVYRRQNPWLGQPKIPLTEDQDD